MVMMIVMMMQAAYEGISAADACHLLCLEDGHAGDADDDNDDESTFSLPWTRMCCACAAMLNSPHRLIIAAQGAVIMTRHDCWCECSCGIYDVVVITPHALEQGGSIRCSLCSDYEPMRAVQDRCTGTTHSGPG